MAPVILDFKEAVRTRFKLGVPCFTKKETIPVVIVDVLGKGHWKVAKVEATGEISTSITFPMKSQQLRKPKQDDWEKGNIHPLILRPPPTVPRPTFISAVGQGINRILSPARRNGAPGREDTTVDPLLHDPHDVRRPLLDTNTAIRNPPSSSYSGVISATPSTATALSQQQLTPVRPAQEGQRLLTPVRSPLVTNSPNNLLGLLMYGSDDDSDADVNAVAEDDADAGVGSNESIGSDDGDIDEVSCQDSDKDPDEEVEEDFDYARYDEEDEEGDTGTNFGIIGQAVEANNDKYVEKWNKYKAERASLISDGFVLKGKPAKQQGIEIGRRVKMRRGDRKGYVVEKDGESPPVWSIRFDDIPNSIESGIPSTTLTLVKDKRIFTWKCVEDSFPDNPIHGFEEHGVVGFDFDQFDPEKLSLDNANYDFPYLRLLIHLWPGKIFCIIEMKYFESKCISPILKGNWKEQLQTLNTQLSHDNNHRTSRRQPIRTVTDNEWWAFWGIIFSASPAGKGGDYLFRKQTERKVIPDVNFGRKHGLGIMAQHRFKNIKENIHFAFYDRNFAETDPYHPVKSLLDGFNNNRKKNIASSIDIVLDESMSPFRPRTTSSSLLPNLSFIFRKPKPLGIELKVRSPLFQNISAKVSYSHSYLY